MEGEQFYEHFHRDRPTRLGNWITKVSADKILGYAGMKPGHAVLEIGPGRGVFADICLAKGLEYWAVEANQQMAESLQARGARVIHAMVPPLPPLDHKFDFVVMIHVMEHMSTMPDALQISGQIRKVLKPHGKLVICSPDYLNLRHNFFNCDFSHSYVTTRRRLEQLLIGSGYHNLKSRYFSGPLAGISALLASTLIARLPFASLNAFFPDSRIIRKFYKAQLSFSRQILIIGQRHSQS